MLWLVKYVSESEMRLLDKEVDRLCAIDGRSVIYETVKLPASKFNSCEQPRAPQSDKDDTGFGYYIQGRSKRYLNLARRHARASFGCTGE